MNIPKNLLPDETSPDWMNKADNAWQLTAATLVGLQGIPGLAILYAGMVEKRWAVNSISMVLYAFASVLICWVGWAFRMSFGEELTAFWGKPGVALDDKYLTEQAFLGYFPNATMVLFQSVFAAITLILVGGALLGRMNFKAWMLFVPLWLTFSYTIGAYSVWNPNGWLAKLGVIDFAGGYVIHLASGVSGFTAAFWVGPRTEKDLKCFPPNNILMVVAGGGLLWMGWSGFNGGAPYAASTLVSLAVLNTHVCTSTSILTWLVLDTFTFGKPSIVGAVQGMITGLVCITPGAGLVQCWAAVLMGLFSGSIPWYTMSILQHKIKFLRQVDDTLGVFHTHAITGILGGLLTGFFAVPRLCRLFFAVPDKYTGLLYALHMGQTSRGFRQMGLQLIGMAFIACLNFITTSLICLFIKLIVPLKMTDAELEIGDEVVHGEQAYAYAYALKDQGDNGFENTRKNSIYDADECPSIVTETSSREVAMRRI